MNGEIATFLKARASKVCPADGLTCTLPCCLSENICLDLFKDDVLPPVTPEAVAAAKAATQRERDEAYRQTGVRVDDNGRAHLPARAAQVNESTGPEA
jgi:hypothetical protein